MKEQIRISHPELLTFTSWSAPGVSEEGPGKVLSWRSDELDTPTLTACTAAFDTLRSFNAVHILANESHPDFFPRTFRIEISADGTIWEPILRESDFVPGQHGGRWHFPLIEARYIKFLFVVDKPNAAGAYFSAFGEFRVMVSGIVQLDVSSELDRLWVKENLTDGRPEYGWSSMLRSKKQEEWLQLDLGSINRVGEIRLLSKNDNETFFPEVFRISYSEDDLSWHHLLEENGFLAEPGTWYRWRFLPTNVRYLKLTVDEGAKSREGKYVSQIIEIELYAAPDLIEKSGKSEPEAVPYASVLRSGIVRLAMDGEVREGVVIQWSDRRLRDATAQNKGIVELAADGEDAALVAVQGNDRRLKYATEDMPGITRFARDGEVRAGHAVQGSDRRLKPSTEDEMGLVELAAD
ncbi:MAG: discoidin domain-containing protein, partial [Spirochaetia bacterium]|nr:discoidin domain-containing protein [Spirochaetia bacterium]